MDKFDFIKELVAGEVVKKIFDYSQALLKEHKITLFSSKNDILDSLKNHITLVKNWSNEVNFKDLKSSKTLINIHIPLNIYLYPKRIRINESETIGIIHLDEVFKYEKNHIVILGQPGAGKTTSMKFICQSIFFNNDFYPEFKLPILIKLREFNKPIKDKGHAGVIIEALYKIFGLEIKISSSLSSNEEFLIRLKQKLVIEVLNHNKFLIIIDGFDEISFKKHQEIVKNEIEMLASQIEESRIILTSRTAEYDYSFENTAVFELCSLNDNQILDFSEKWLGSKENALSFTHEISKTPFVDTAIRPLTIAHLCAIYERNGKIPEKPKTVYKKIITLLIEEWDEQRNIKRESKYALLEIDRKFEFLTCLAFELTKVSKKSIFSTHELQNAYSKIYENFDLNQKEAKIVIKELESHTGLFIQSGFEFYEFAHKSIQEYLTAEYLVKLPSIPTDTKIIENFPNEFAIAIGISSNPSQYFSEFVYTRLNKSKLSYQFIRTFINRILIEKPDFYKNDAVGINALILYSIYLGKSADNLQLTLFIVDDLVREFENLMEGVFKRNSLINILNLYNLSSKSESTSSDKVYCFTLKNNFNFLYSKAARNEGMSDIKDLPKILNCRESFLTMLEIELPELK